MTSAVTLKPTTETQRRPSTLLRWLFRLPGALYCVGLAGQLERSTLQLTTRGRRSERRRTTALNHLAQGDVVYVVSGRGYSQRLAAEPPGGPRPVSIVPLEPQPRLPQPGPKSPSVPRPVGRLHVGDHSSRGALRATSSPCLELALNDVGAGVPATGIDPLFNLVPISMIVFTRSLLPRTPVRCAFTPQ
jgi:hypothetical protein